MPGPALVTPSPAPPSPMTPPTVSVPALTVTCTLPPSVTGPPPRLRLVVPAKAKLPFHFIPTLLPSVSAPLEVLSIVPPLMVRADKVLPLMANACRKFSVPPLSVHFVG